MPGTVLFTAPTLEPVSLAEQRQHMKFTATDAAEDALISGWITAARENVEKITGLKLISQVWRAVYDEYPDERVLKLPFSPVISVDEIKTTDKAAAPVVFASSNYIVDLVSVPARIVLKDTASWPAPSAGLQEANAVEVKFTAGYGSATAVADLTAANVALSAAEVLVAAAVTAPEISAAKAALAAAALQVTAAQAALVTVVPSGLRSAIMLLAAHLYENREATSVVKFEELPCGIQALIAPYRTWQRGI